ncbi:MAG: SusC/RagA family TonB-linked outer membrane protein [Gemmatimonadaceae bacterium]|nr:SusC/RagA family TonB-linked outer membrane protein [Gemmatimonadaceae bacterium]
MTRFRRSSRLAGLLAGLATTVLASTAFAQNAVISGTVKSAQGQAIQAANIRIADLNISVGSGDDGTYRITVAGERVRGQTVAMAIRAIGFRPQTRNVTISAGNQTVDFTLEVDINRLSEVVVTGVTGATEAKKLAFTVDKVDQANLPVPATSALQSLQGKVTGAQVVTPSGRPGAAPAILLRGAKSLNLSLSPLIVVDGIIMNGSMNDINPQDIESIEVVKGAAAASTYGSRAQNGVIQITTKSGATAGQGARFQVRSETGVQDIQGAYPFSQRHWLTMDETEQNFCILVTNQPACSRVVDLYDYTYYVNNIDDVQARLPANFENDAGIGLAMSKPGLRGNFQIKQWPIRYNPIAAATTANLYSNNNVDMSGRFGNTGFFASASNLIQMGAIKFLDGYRRSTARLNVDQAVGEDLTFNMSTMYARTATFPETDFFVLTRTPAFVDLLRRDSYGRLFIRHNVLNQGQQNENPLWDAENFVSRTDVDRYLGSVSSRYTPFPWLDFDANAAIDRRRDNQYSLTEKGYRVTRTNQSTAYLGAYSENAGSDVAFNMAINGTARQTNPFGINDLQTRLNARYSFERSDSDGFSAGGNTLAVPGLLTLGNVQVPGSPTSSSNSVRAIGMLGGVAVDYKGKYIFDAVMRRDGSSLFGSAQRWHTYGRVSAAWRLSDEGWWPFKGAINDMKLRYSLGSAGGRPGFSYQYETFSVGAGGTVSSNQLGNRFLKPETTTETELGFDAELFSKYGLQVTYAHDRTEDQMLQVPAVASSGFSNQWQNAGTVVNKTYEVSLNIPLITNRDIVWTSRLSYDRNRAFLTELYVPEFSRTSASSRFEFRAGERLGTVYGKWFVTECDQLEPQFAAQCGEAGTGAHYQKNDMGYIVWTGGLDWTQGITNNAWQATLPGCISTLTGAVLAATGRVACQNQAGAVNNPWAIPLTNWGMLIVERDSTGTPVNRKLGNTSPDFRLSMSHNFNWKKLTLYALVEGNYGNRLFNQEIHWSLGDYMVRYEDQDGRSVLNAKPMGFYWRAPQPEHGSGVGGFYDVLGSNNQTVTKGTYTKLREVSASYQIGAIRGVGDFSLTLVGRNLYTITDFLGWDPEVGGGVLGSAAFGAVAAFDYPQTRTFTFTIATRF